MSNIIQITTGSVADNNSFFITTGDKTFRVTVDVVSDVTSAPVVKQLDVVEVVQETETSTVSETTIVTALWNMGRDQLNEQFKRPYSNYLQFFAELLKTDVNMFIYVSKEDEEFIWKHRSPHNTKIKLMELEDFKTWFPFFDKVAEIRNNNEWVNRAGWLHTSPQAILEYYNPVVMSKMFLLNDASLVNPFDSKYFFWLDAGIGNTVHPGYFYHDKVHNNLPKFIDHIDKFLFISYPYTAGDEVHGFERKALAKYCNTDFVRYVCRGGFFGGKKEHINYINSIYYSILDSSLTEGLMGTEESIFTIIAHQHPELVTRFEIGEDGLIWPFFEKLKTPEILINELPKKLTHLNAKNILYILGFNSPQQFDSVCKSIKSSDFYLFERSRKILINNSNDMSLFEEYDKLCSVYNFEEIHLDNIGISAGRQFVAEHFDESDADFYMFFEDDMHLNTSTHFEKFCRNGFKTYVPNFYKTVLKIIIKENLDFLKFSFSEFYGDNSTQWAWYNVPQEVRTEFWPDYDKLPDAGLDLNAPKTHFTTIDTVDEVSYIKGEIYYSNWPQIVSRSGNKKMFLNTKWAHPFEQTWMSHMFQLMKKNELTSAVLLSSPITHNRFDHYTETLRKES